MKKRFLQIHPADNVMVALTDLKKGEIIDYAGAQFSLKDDVAAKHKFMLQEFKTGDEVVMYGVLVGKTIKPVPQGGVMTTANVNHASGDFKFRNVTYQWSQPDVSKYAQRNFKGYVRSDGRVGTANYWLFIPTVFCENRNLDVIREALHNELGYAVTGKYKLKVRSLVDNLRNGSDLAELDLSRTELMPVNNRVFQNVDGIKFLNHQGGCGGTRQDSATLGALLTAYADHPNVGGVTVLSLGCQHLQADDFRKDLLKRNPKFDKPLLIFEQQKSQSEESLITDAIRQTFLGLVEINKISRQEVSLDKLVVGVKCGGSDGFSGISANPAVGSAADKIVALGGKVLLAEFPELCGAEQELVDRCVDQSTAEKFIRLMKDYDAEARRVGSGFHMNPSPGNIRDGLITDAIKSAGAAKKGGTSPVADVLDYTEPAVKPGLSLVCTPGNDVEATTGKAASGATLILFTTGLGTPTGNPVCPTIKVATNSALARRMHDIIDIDTGPIIEGEKSIEEMGDEILEYCIRAASGEIIPKAVQLNQDDFIPWKRGVSL
jgi:altronate hydrolase